MLIFLGRFRKEKKIKIGKVVSEFLKLEWAHLTSDFPNSKVVLKKILYPHFFE